MNPYARRSAVGLIAAVVLGVSVAYAAPPIPSGLTATAASSTQINLTWGAASGAAAYRILRSTVSGGPYSQVGMSSSTNFANSGLTAGTTYYYVVQSYNGTFSASSSPVSATTLTGATASVPPSAPANLVGAASGGTVVLSWTASTGAPVYRYEIWRGTASGAEIALDAIGGLVTTYTDLSPPSAGGLYYQVYAVGAYGRSLASNEVFVPGAPALSVSPAPNDTQIFLSWTASAGATGYKIFAGTSSGTETLLTTVGPSPTTFTHSPLGASATRFYYVVAQGTGGTGTSVNSNEVTATTTVVPAPTGVTLNVISSTQIDVSWTPPSATAAPDRSSYNVYFGTSNPPGGPPQAVAGGVSFSTSLTSLSPGTLYYVQVETVASGNPGSPSAKTTAVSATTTTAPAGSLYIPQPGSITKVDPTTGAQSIFASIPAAAGGLTTDAAGNFYAADYANAIYKVSPSGTYLGANFAASVYIASDPSGTIYSTTNGGPYVVRYPGASNPGTVFVPNAAGVGFTSGLGTMGIIFDAAGNLYYANNQTGQILKTTPAGGTANTTVFSTIPGVFFAPGPIPQETGSSNAQLAFDASENLYVATLDARIIKIATTGPSTGVPTVFTSALAAPPWSVPPGQGRLAGCAVDPSGNVYVSQTSPVQRIFKITPGGSVTVVTTLSNPAFGILFR